MATKKGKLAELKTKPTATSVDEFIESIEADQKKNDSKELVQLMTKVSGEQPVLWGSSIIGFGMKRYQSPTSGREVDWFKIGFAPRKSNLTIYIMSTAEHAAALEKLGKHKIGGGCVYVNKLQDIDLGVLSGIITSAWNR